MSDFNYMPIILIANLLLLLYLCFFKKYGGIKNEDEKPDEEVTTPSGIITLQRALRIISNYRPRRDLHNQLMPTDTKTKRAKRDAHSVFASIGDIKSYIRYIEDMAAKKSIPINGLRYYFGAYPHDDDHFTANTAAEDDKRGLQTIVIFPTTTKDFLAIDIEKSTQEEPFFIHDHLFIEGTRGEKQKSVMSLQAIGGNIDSGSSSAYNEMNSSPPRQPVG